MAGRRRTQVRTASLVESKIILAKNVVRHRQDRNGCGGSKVNNSCAYCDRLRSVGDFLAAGMLRRSHVADARHAFAASHLFHAHAVRRWDAGVRRDHHRAKEHGERGRGSDAF